MAKFRTDRNNNLIAAAMYGDKPNGHTAALDFAGIKWSIGDPFPSGKMNTIRIEGDAFEGARAILSYSKSIQNWYINHTGAKVLREYRVWNNKDFQKSTREVQNAIIKGIYMEEGGDGSLLPTPVSPIPTLSQLQNALKWVKGLRYRAVMRAIARLAGR